MDSFEAPFKQHCYFLNTCSLADSAHFYEDVVGLRCVYEQPGFVKFYKVGPECFLGLCLRESREPEDVKGAIPTFVCATPIEVDEWQQRLESAGISIHKRAGPGVSSDGKHIPTLYNLFVHDPNGYLIEFQAFLDPAWPHPGVSTQVAAANLVDLVKLSACELVRKLAAGQLTPLQCIDAFAAQHLRSEPAVNAVPIVCLDRARAAAAQLKPPPTDPPAGWLYGLPVIVKDLSAVQGVRFVRGSSIYADAKAEVSSNIVLALESKGALVVGKSNTPEFGAGSQTFNPVFGTTVTPFDVRCTAGGSSGGSAAALATGAAWLATGSDLGGSLRIPAAFCGA